MSTATLPGEAIGQSVVEHIGKFQEIVRGYCATNVSDLADIEQRIEAVRNYLPPAYDQRTITLFLAERAKAINALCGRYVIGRLQSIYPVVSADLFKLKRHLTVNVQKEQVVLVYDGITPDPSGPPQLGSKKVGKEAVNMRVEVPLFATTRMFTGDHSAEMGHCQYTYQYTGMFNRDIKEKTVSVSLKAKLPGVIEPSIIAMHGKALSDFHRVMSELHAVPAVSEYLTANPFAHPEMIATWIPAPHTITGSVKVDERVIARAVDRDPAMIMKFAGNHFLVAFWDAVDELPFEAHLREFTTGKMPTKTETAVI